MKGRALQLSLLTALAVSGAVAPVFAEPAFAVRTGYRCSQCHANRTGGGIRTAFGSLYTQTILPRKPLSWRDSSNLLPADPDARFAVGADVRLQYLHVAVKDRDDVSSFEVSEANLYLEARLIPGRLSVYLDEKIGPGGASAREMFGMLALSRARSYVKVGKFLPAYGWRLPDDAAFIRQFSGFAYSAPDIGIEFGAEPGRWSFHFAALNGSGGGSDTDRSKRFTLLLAHRYRRGRIGMSAASNVTDGPNTSHVGLLGGANFGRLAVLAETDWVVVRDGTGDTGRVLGLVEANLLVSRGLNVKLAHDYLDPDLDQSTDARTRDSLGVEFTPWPFLQLRAFARVSDGPPQIRGSRDTRFDFELHLFF